MQFITIDKCGYLKWKGYKCYKYICSYILYININVTQVHLKQTNIYHHVDHRISSMNTQKNQYCGLKNPHQNAMKSEIKYVILFNNSITGNYKTQINGLVKGKIFIFQVMMRIYM